MIINFDLTTYRDYNKNTIEVALYLIAADNRKQIAQTQLNADHYIDEDEAAAEWAAKIFTRLLKMLSDEEREKFREAGERYRVVREYAEKRTFVKDPFFNKVYVKHGDGSEATWQGAFVEEYGHDILIIYTEHHGWFVYPRDEVHVEMEPLKEGDKQVWERTDE